MADTPESDSTEPRTEKVTVWLTKAGKQALAEEAAHDSRKLSDFARIQLAEAVNARRKKRAGR